MIAENINPISISIFLIISLLLIYISWKSYKEKKKIINKNKISLKKTHFLKIFFLLSSFIIALSSIFQIKWKETEKQLKTKWVDIMFVLDVSKSMNTADISYENFKTTRLSLAKKAIEDYVIKHPNNRYWLVIFAWEAQSIIPLTSDKNIFLTLLRWVDYKNLTQQWTDFNEALRQTFARFKDDNRWKVVVFISDGWDKGDYKWLNLKIPKEVKTIVIWVWTLEWGKILLWKNPFWWYKYQTYNGQYVITKLNEENLQKLAKDLSWKYIRLDNLDKLSQIDNYIKNLSKHSILSSTKERKDLTRDIIILSFILFVLYLLIELLE